MRRAIAIAELARSSGGAPYGALIADPATGAVLAEGHNHAASNPIWHGEMSAIANLSALSGRSVYDLAPSLELYTTAEPCPMCMGALAWAGFSAVYYGSSIPFIGEHNHSQIMVRAADVAGAAHGMKRVDVVGGVLANETDLLYIGPYTTSTPSKVAAMRGVERYPHEGYSGVRVDPASALRDRLGEVIASIRRPHDGTPNAR